MPTAEAAEKEGEAAAAAASDGDVTLQEPGLVSGLSAYYLRQGGCVFVAVCVSVCLSVCWQLCAKTSERICMKCSGKVGNGPVNKRLNFGGEPDHRLGTGIVSAFVTIGRYGKWYQPTALRDAAVQGAQ